MDYWKNADMRVSIYKIIIIINSIRKILLQKKIEKSSVGYTWSSEEYSGPGNSIKINSVRCRSVYI